MAGPQVRTTKLGPHVSNGVPKLWAALKKRNWSQGDLARALDAPSGLVNRWLHGHRPVGLKWALAIEKLLGIDAIAWTEPTNEPVRLRRTA